MLTRASSALLNVSVMIFIGLMSELFTIDFLQHFCFVLSHCVRIFTYSMSQCETDCVAVLFRFVALSNDKVRIKVWPSQCQD